MDYDAGDLRIEDETNSYFIQYKRRFLMYASMLEDDLNECFDFAYNMSYGGLGHHRNHRTGGTEQRTKGQIFINTFQGKMGEFALYRFLQNKNIDVDRPDVDTYDEGIWDTFDLDCQEKHISVKSTKSYGNLLLLETGDWNDNGEYIPNLRNEGTTTYQYTVLVRFEPDGEKIMATNHLLLQNDNSIPNNIREILIEKVRNNDWKYDFPGFIYYSELVKMIRERKIIPRGVQLNGSTEMDAENYYFQAGNMHSMCEMYTINQDNEEHLGDMLKRRCPECGQELRMVHGPHSDFWGCKGFMLTGCHYHEPLERRIRPQSLR